MLRLIEYFEDMGITEKNTYEGALQLACNLLTYERYTHSLAVSDRVISIAKELDFSEDDLTKARIAGMIHNIGYSERLLISPVHNLNGFYYLLFNGWDVNYQEVALKHNYSKQLIDANYPNMTSVYDKASKLVIMQNPDIELNNIITIANMTVSSKGVYITLKEKKEEIVSTYGHNSLELKHFLSTETRLKELEDRYLIK